MFNGNKRDTIFDIVQSYCFQNSYTNLVQKFSSHLSDCIIRLLDASTLTPKNLLNQAIKRNDFFIANNIANKKQFIKDIYDKLIYELSFYKPVSFYDSIIEFKRRLENGIAKDFPNGTLEAPLRGCLSAYITEENFCETRSSSGRSDICVPSEKIIIETKLWKGKKYYESGFPELEEYLDKNNYIEGYYIIFDYNKTINHIIKSKGEIFDENYFNKLFHIIFIRMNSISPSQKYKN